MKLNLSAAAMVATVVVSRLAGGAETVPGFIYETPNEFIGSGDFDGDGRKDLVIVDKDSGKYRLAYQLNAGVFTWEDCRPSGVKGVSGCTIGKLLDAKRDALAVTGPEANQIVILDASSATAPSRPLAAEFTGGLGASTIVAVNAGGEKGLADFFVASVYNSPDPNLATLVRNDGVEFPKLEDVSVAGVVARGNRFSLKAGEPERLSFLIRSNKGDILRIDDFAGGKPKALSTTEGLPAGADYAVGNFRGSPSCDFVIYKPGDSSITARPVEDVSGGPQLGKGTSFDLKEAVQQVIALEDMPGAQLFVIFGKGEKAGVFKFDGKSAPALVQTIYGTNDTFTGAQSVPGGYVAFLQPAGGKFSVRYQFFKAGAATYAVFGGLPSLADNDNITIPDIHLRITTNASSMAVKSEKDMQLYTNTIPGTMVTYKMVPIPGGEFVMGSLEGEANRKADEGPQHKVKISPFWMQQCEVTWNEYELFMYPDEEKRTRATMVTDSAGDKLADAVTHPSKPYVEMSFGMGKDGYPAIAMTHHAANKYCQWLSAKTGHFYRLPTEAEWEYACRAGTTTSHFFGDDASKLGEFAWYEENSDFKYQKVGKKKPNPWGLYDMYGNVVEWVLDQYDADYYKKCSSSDVTIDPWNKATQPYPHAVRGGSWDDAAPMCRTAARRGSDRAWKMQDPQLPKSIWYFSDAQFVGFRIVRPLKIPQPEDMQKYWTSGTEKD